MLRTAMPQFRVDQAINALHRGGVIAYPTEAVWGLGCDPANEIAVDRLLALKHRAVSKGLILVASESAQLGALLTDLDSEQRELLARSWPGSTTWLIPHRGLVPEWIHGDHDTVAVRVSRHPTVCALCDAWGGLLVSSSANCAGKVAAVQQFQVRRYFGERLDCIVPGSVGADRRPSRIRDLLSDTVIRA